MKNVAAFALKSYLAFALFPSLSSTAQAVEVAPFAGFRYGGGFEDANTLSRFAVGNSAARGLLLDFDSEPDQQIEVLLSRQATQLSTAGPYTGNPLFGLTIDYYHIGGLYMLPDFQRVRPFVSGTFGLTRMAPQRSGLTTENHLSLSLGSGAKFFLTKNLGLRFDMRAIYTMVNADTAIFCNGGCTIKVRSNGLVQTEIGAALLVRF